MGNGRGGAETTNLANDWASVNYAHDAMATANLLASL